MADTPSKKPGRPSKYTPEVRAGILAALRVNTPRNHAAEAAGVSYETMRQWMRKGEAGDPDYVDFVQAVREAEASAFQTYHERINEAIECDEDIYKAAKLASWMLEKRDPKNYGNRQTIEHEGGINVQAHDFSDLTFEEKLQLRKLLKKAKSTDGSGD
jgi:hypothetical protein